jgi:tRNA(Ile)-lysidine synthase
MALALILQELGYTKMIAVTVNHRLRPEAEEEARQVGRWLRDRGIKQQILTYKGVVPEANIEAKARALRYELLKNFARREKIKYVLIAHTLEDQAETFLLRLGRGSGLYGLASMDEKIRLGTVEVVRPMLGIGREDLREYLRSEGQQWVHDPSNDDTRYTRVKMRKLLPILTEHGISVERIALATSHLQRVKRFVEKQIASVGVTYSDTGAEIMLDALLEADEEVALRVLAEALARAAGKPFPPRFNSLTSLYQAIVSGEMKRRTLAGCIISLRPVKRLVTITREE